MPLKPADKFSNLLSCSSRTGVAKMGDKGPEVMVCDASIMKNVWEIRLRDYGQKLKLENERIEKSALDKINDDWAKRMSGKIKPRRVERKSKPPEDSPAQAFKTKTSLGRPSGFVSSRPQKSVDVKKEPTKRNKLALLLRLGETQPGLMIWTKSWKFSQSLSEQTPPASDWGQSWKFFNLQPNNEAKSWMEQEHDRNNIAPDDVLLFWKKADKAVEATPFQQDISDWEQSWKCTKQRKEAHGNEEKNTMQDKFHVLKESQIHNEERYSSEWNESWKSVKPLDGEHVQFINESLNGPENVKESEQEPGFLWAESWKHFKKVLHVKSKSASSIKTGWVESWRISKPTSKISQQEKIPELQTYMPEEPLDPTIYQTLSNVSRDEKYNLWNSFQLQEGDVNVSVDQWQKSWVTIKNLTEYKELPVETPQVAKQTNKQTKCNIPLVKPVKFEPFPLPKAHKSADLLELLKPNNKDFISTWKDSWKSFKHQRRQEKIDNRRQRVSFATQTSIAQPALSEWTNSWRLTNLNGNQDADIWQQGWSSNVRPRPDRWARESEAVIEHFTLNGFMGARGWGESWRFARQQHHRAEREGMRPKYVSVQPENLRLCRRARSLADWGESCQFSASQDHRERPSIEEWGESWKFCVFHSDDWMEREREIRSYKTSLDIRIRKERCSPSTKFSQSFELQSFKKRFPPKDWSQSWKTKSSDAKEQRKPGLLQLSQKEDLQDWDDSWMVSFAQFYQSKVTDSAPTNSRGMTCVTNYESQSEWGRSWKLSNPQPPTNLASWFEAQPYKCSPQYFVFWSWHRRGNHLLSQLSKNNAALRFWDKAWRFMKMESKLNFKPGIAKSKREDESVIMIKLKMKKSMYSQIDKTAPQAKRWTDACKLAKTQPRPRRDARIKPDRDERERAMFVEWAESWRYANESMSVEPVKMPVSLMGWEESWKFLLTPYSTQNGPKQSKGRS